MFFYVQAGPEAALQTWHQPEIGTWIGIGNVTVTVISSRNATSSH